MAGLDQRVNHRLHCSVDDPATDALRTVEVPRRYVPEGVFDRFDNNAHHPRSTGQASTVERQGRVNREDKQRRQRRRDERGLVSIG